MDQIVLAYRSFEGHDDAAGLLEAYLRSRMQEDNFPENGEREALRILRTCPPLKSAQCRVGLLVLLQPADVALPASGFVVDGAVATSYDAVLLDERSGTVHRVLFLDARGGGHTSVSRSFVCRRLLSGPRPS